MTPTDQNNFKIKTVGCCSNKQLVAVIVAPFPASWLFPPTEIKWSKHIVRTYAFTTKSAVLLYIRCMHLTDSFLLLLPFPEHLNSVAVVLVYQQQQQQLIAVYMHLSIYREHTCTIKPLLGKSRGGRNSKQETRSSLPFPILAPSAPTTTATPFLRAAS